MTFTQDYPVRSYWKTNRETWPKPGSGNWEIEEQRAEWRRRKCQEASACACIFRAEYRRYV